MYTYILLVDDQKNKSQRTYEQTKIIQEVVSPEAESL